MSGPDAATDPGVLLDRIEARLAATRASLDSGEPGNLDGFEGEVALLRERLAALPAARAQGLRPRLLAVIDEIDRLSADFRSGLDRLGKELGQTGRRRQAVSAYSQGQQNKPGGR